MVMNDAGRNRTEIIQPDDLHHKAVCPDCSPGGKGGVSAVPVQGIPRKAERPHPAAAEPGRFQRGDQQNRHPWLRAVRQKVRHRLCHPQRTPPKCHPCIWSFFKATDAEAFHSAFKEYSASLLNKDKRPSVLARLQELVQAAAELPRQSPAQGTGAWTVTTKKLTKLLALYLPYILLGLVATNFGEAWRLAEGKELGDKIMSLMGTIPVAFATPCPVCTRWICWWACAAVQGYGWRSICVAKTLRSTGTAWSTALPGGAPQRILSRSWLPSLRTISSLPKRNA